MKIGTEQTGDSDNPFIATGEALTPDGDEGVFAMEIYELGW